MPMLPALSRRPAADRSSNCGSHRPELTPAEEQARTRKPEPPAVLPAHQWASLYEEDEPLDLQLGAVACAQPPAHAHAVGGGGAGEPHAAREPAAAPPEPAAAPPRDGAPSLTGATAEAAAGELLELANARGHTCPICLDVLYRPESLQCGHSYCVHCIGELRDKNGVAATCPECRGGVNPIPNRALTATVEQLYPTQIEQRRAEVEALLNEKRLKANRQKLYERMRALHRQNRIGDPNYLADLSAQLTRLDDMLLLCKCNPQCVCVRRMNKVRASLHALRGPARARTRNSQRAREGA